MRIGPELTTSLPLIQGFLTALSVGVGAIVGLISQSGENFAVLDERLSVPIWLLSLGWLAFFVVTAFIGARLVRLSSISRRWRRELALWVVQLVLCWSWSPLAMRFGTPGWAAIAAALSFAILLFILVRLARRGRTRVVFAPAVIWLGYIVSVSLQIARLGG